ncbi:M48 family metalloprotease [Galbitalea soli]|uniref:M48 family metalloprotease n=1 Tax=Galbitalea soli TaxID=1268042 RepID=UPI001575C812|nr:Zn-dependent protease with chaperone function [Galbitalea soli]
MLTASLALAALALVLAWPAPILLARAAWPSRAPATALLLWQAIALAGGLSMIGSLLTFGLIPFGGTLISGLGGFARALSHGITTTPLVVVSIASLSLAGVLAAHLLLNLALTLVVTERQRLRHRRLVELLSSPSATQPNTRVLDSAAPLAYCLPGNLGSITVLSRGLVSLLDDAELAAVVEHEKAHLIQRHYVVLLAFDAWRTSLPWFPIATRAQHEVGLLVEMLADDTARRSTDSRTLALAIALVAGGTPGRDGDPSGGTTLPGTPALAPAGVVRSATGIAYPADTRSHDRDRLRLTRLVDPPEPLTLAARAGVIAVAVALVAVPTVLLIAPSLA